MTLPIVSGTLYFLAMVLLGCLHAMDRTVRWVHDPVSDYGVGPHAFLFKVYGHLGTAAALLLTIQFFRSSAPAFSATVLSSMVALLAFRIGVILVPTDRRGEHTLRGTLHLLLAVGTFAATYTAIANATPSFSSAGAASAVAPLDILRHLALASLTAVVVTMLPPAKALFGIAERAFLVSSMLWFLAGNLWFAGQRP